MRAPILCSSRLLGISKMEQPKKKIPKSNPYCWPVMASSLVIVNAAKPVLIRSRKQTTKRSKTKGRILIRTFWIVLASMVIPPVSIPWLMMTSVRVRPDQKVLSAGVGGQRRVNFVETVCLQGTQVMFGTGMLRQFKSDPATKLFFLFSNFPTACNQVEDLLDFPTSN